MDADIEAALAPSTYGLNIAFEPVTACRHRAEPEVGCIQHMIEHRSNRESLERRFKGVIAGECISQRAERSRFALEPLQIVQLLQQ